jgi:hypothetical protein
MGVPEPKGYFKYVVIVSGILAVLAVHTGWRMMQDRETLAKVRKSVREDLVERLRDFYFEFGRLPSDIEEFFSTDYLPPGKDIAALQDLGYNEVYTQAVAMCRSRIPSWREELDRGRVVFHDLRGDLSAQLDLFLDPEFYSPYSARFFARLHSECGVSPEIVKEFAQANMNLFLASASEKKLNHSGEDSSMRDLQHQLNEFHIEHSPGRLSELRQEILKEAKANGFDKGIDPNVEHAPAPMGEK